MKKWELVLLIALVLSILAGVIFPATTQAPQVEVYAWWGAMYPGFVLPEVEQGQSYVLKSKTVELWRDLKMWLQTVA